MLDIFRYILSNNRIYKVPKHILIAGGYQIFKRITGAIISKKIFNGAKIFLYPKCNVSTLFVYTDIPDKEEIQLLRNKAINYKKEMVIFLDIGANIGSYSICMMDVCFQVLAFEPHPYTSKRCKMNFLLNNLPETSVHQLALSDTTGKLHFSDFGSSSTVNHIVESSSADTITVDTITLDNFLHNNTLPIDKKYLIKVDVEGFEEQVFLGARNFLQNYNIIGIIFENFDKPEVFSLLNDLGFSTIDKISNNNYYARKNSLD